MPSLRPTLEQVADHAGVSRATVSRVVNGSPTVDPALAARVADSIRALDYVPNQAARSLMTGRAGMVALVVAESDTRVFGDPFFSGIVRGVTQELSRAGMQLILAMAHDGTETARIQQFLMGGHVDGVLFISEHSHADFASQVAASGVPLVVGGRPLSPSPGLRFVDNDNIGGARLAARHLMSLGRERIGSITGPTDMSAGIDRLEGFSAELGSLYDAGRVEAGEFTSESGAAAAAALLDRHPDLDGLFVASDLMALGAIQAIRRTGRRVPQDVAVVGFDDIPLAAVADPPLTTIRQHTVEQGRLMVRLLLTDLDGEPLGAGPEAEVDADGRRVSLPVELVVRESA